MIANAIKEAYSTTAPTHLGAGIDIPCTERRCAHSKRIFYAQVLWWVNQRLFGAPFLSTGYVNSDSPATLLFDINGGSFQNFTEDTIMNTYDVNLCALTLPELRALKTILQNYLERDLSGFADNRIQSTIHARTACNRVLEAISDVEPVGGVQ